eukprot:COSAG02_NODE_4223_length_5615_cov_2.992386_6_plen_88_part_00
MINIVLLSASLICIAQRHALSYGFSVPGALWLHVVSMTSSKLPSSFPTERSTEDRPATKVAVELCRFLCALLTRGIRPYAPCHARHT